MRRSTPELLGTVRRMSQYAVERKETQVRFHSYEVRNNLCSEPPPWQEVLGGGVETRAGAKGGSWGAGNTLLELDAGHAQSVKMD